MIDFGTAPAFGIPTRDGLGVREGMLIECPQGWGEFSPPPECDRGVAARWLTAAIEGGTVGWPDPLRGRIPIAVSVAAVDSASARATVEASGCRTADVTVGVDSLEADAARVGAVRDALGSQGRIRLQVNRNWSVEDAVRAIGILTAAAGELEFVAHPCRTATELAAVRRRVRVAIAAGVSSAEAVDVVILRTSPLGGVRRSLRIAERLERPCVVASSGETSIGLASSLALAGALPELPFACALGTVSLLVGDLVAEPRSLRPVDGYLPVAPASAGPDPVLLKRYALTDSARIDRWRQRLQAARTPD